MTDHLRISGRVRFDNGDERIKFIDTTEGDSEVIPREELVIMFLMACRNSNVQPISEISVEYLE